MEYIAVVNINAIIHQKIDNILYPKAVNADSFAITLNGQTEQECLDELKQRLNGLQNENGK